MCSERVCSSCFTSGTRCVYLVANPVIRYSVGCVVRTGLHVYVFIKMYFSIAERENCINARVFTLLQLDIDYFNFICIVQLDLFPFLIVIILNTNYDNRSLIQRGNVTSRHSHRLEIKVLSRMHICIVHSTEAVVYTTGS